VKKYLLIWYPIAVGIFLTVLILAGMFSPRRDEGDHLAERSFSRNNNQQSLPYQQPIYGTMPAQYPQNPQQLAALQVNAGPARVQGSLQIPEIGAEVLYAPAGLIVTRVYQASHAERGGMLAGDMLIKFAGQQIVSPDMFFRAISAAPPEASVEFVVLRSGRLISLNIMMGKRELDGVIVPLDAAPAHPYALPG